MSVRDLNKMFAGKSVLALVGTPFQLFSLMSLTADIDTSSCARFDVLIIDQFHGAREYAERIRRQGFFTSVACACPGVSYYEHLSLSFVWNVLRRNQDCFDRLTRCFPEICSRRYQVFLCSYPDRVALELKYRCCPEGISILFDDGTASSSGVVFQLASCFDWAAVRCKMSSGGLRGAMKRLLRGLMCFILPNEALLHIKAFCLLPTGSIAPVVPEGVCFVRMKPLGSGRMLHEVFLSDGNRQEDWRARKTIFFTGPDNLTETAKKGELEILSTLERISGNAVAIKVHPRRCREDFSGWDKCILPDDMWEAVVASGAIDDTFTLISICSTAQVTPKMLMGVEPRLVFLHDLFSSCGIPSKKFESFAGQVANMYVRKESVFCPHSLDEIKGCLRYWIVDGVR